MKIKLYSKKWGELPLADNMPEAPEGLIFPGAQVKVAHSEPKGYCYLFQQFETSLVTIRYCCFYSIEKDLLTVVTDVPAIAFRFGSNNSHCVLTKHLGKQAFHERNFNCFYDPDPSAEYPIGPEERFIFFEIFPKKDYSLYLRYYFPIIKELMGKVAAGCAGKLALYNQVAPIEQWKWAEDLENWCHDAGKHIEGGTFISNKLIEKGLASVNPPPAKRGIVLSQLEINKIYIVAEIICNSDKEFLLQELAAMARLSPYRLNAGFKAIFGYPVTKHKFEEKMLLALQFIDCSDATNEQVATLLGYSDPKKFSREFSKRFGYAPFAKDKEVPE